MLVSFSVSMWTARKIDKKVTKEVADNHGTSEIVGRYNKRLLPQDAESYARIMTAAGAARLCHYENTLPWAQDGSRILPAAHFLEYSRKMRQHQEAFESAVADFLSVYPTLIENARAQLNGLFQITDYPRQSQLRRKFEMITSVMPFPNVDDFRVDLGDEHVDRLRAQIQESVATATEGAMRDAWTRLSEALSKMSNKLSEPEAIYRDSLFNNLAELCDILPRLNLTDDPKLDEITEKIREKVLVCSPATAREDKVARAELAEKVRQIEGMVSDCFVSLEEDEE
jgi:hypothetical protein